MIPIQRLFITGLKKYSYIPQMWDVQQPGIVQNDIVAILLRYGLANTRKDMAALSLGRERIFCSNRSFRALSDDVFPAVNPVPSAIMSYGGWADIGVINNR